MDEEDFFDENSDHMDLEEAILESLKTSEKKDKDILSRIVYDEKEELEKAISESLEMQKKIEEEKKDIPPSTREELCNRRLSYFRKMFEEKKNDIKI